MVQGRPGTRADAPLAAAVQGALRPEHQRGHRVQARAEVRVQVRVFYHSSGPHPVEDVHVHAAHVCKSSGARGVREERRADAAHRGRPGRHMQQVHASTHPRGDKPIKAATRVLQRYMAAVPEENTLLPLRVAWREQVVTTKDAVPIAKITWLAHARVCIELAHDISVVNFSSAMEKEWAGTGGGTGTGTGAGQASMDTTEAHNTAEAVRRMERGANNGTRLRAICGKRPSS